MMATGMTHKIGAIVSQKNILQRGYI